ncbi:MAG: twin-arginine translocation signal domain-containing protein [Bacteroidota bacterium]|nr:twin-arginine translocation signal domain-containing protein [Bacteroidota bacterium]
MERNDQSLTTDRRSFIGTMATGAVAMTVGSIAAPLTSLAKNAPVNNEDPDAWFNKIKGKHRIVFDATEPNGVFPFAWPRVFLLTNAMTGTPEKDSNVVVVLRHNAIPYAMNNALWTKYNFGDVFKINDEKTKASAVRNAFYKPDAGDFKIPGIGAVAIGINELQDSGVMFCVCNMALTVNSAVVAKMNNLNAGDVYNDFKAGVLPNIQIVPSGVWAVGRAQEHGCAYCKA